MKTVLWRPTGTTLARQRQLTMPPVVAVLFYFFAVIPFCLCLNNTIRHVHVRIHKYSYINLLLFPVWVEYINTWNVHNRDSLNTTFTFNMDLTFSRRINTPFSSLPLSTSRFSDIESSLLNIGVVSENLLWPLNWINT